MRYEAVALVLQVETRAGRSVRVLDALTPCVRSQSVAGPSQEVTLRAQTG